MRNNQILEHGPLIMQPGKQLTCRKANMVIIKIVVIHKSGIHPGLRAVDPEFYPVVEWTCGRIERVEHANDVSHDGNFPFRVE